MHAIHHRPVPIHRGNNRHKTFFSSLEKQVAADNPVRLIDAFINKLDLEKMGFTKRIHKIEGREFYIYSC